MPRIDALLRPQRKQPFTKTVRADRADVARTGALARGGNRKVGRVAAKALQIAGGVAGLLVEFYSA